MEPKLKYFDAFSGIGGFSLGMPPNWECVGYSEIDKYAIQIYEKHFKHQNFGDITKINASELPDFDLFCGGFPCQAFSIAGKRRGFDDTRGTLFFDIARILKEKQPRLCLLENVKGLLSHDNGRTFKTIIATLTEVGYDIQWQVLNSKNHGVPQNRERVFIIGHLRGTPRPKVFPFGYDAGKVNKEVKRERITTSRTRNFGSSAQLHSPDEICSTLTYSMGTGGNNVPCVLDSKAKTGFYAVLISNRINKRQNGRIIKEDGEPSFTLTTQNMHGVSDGTKIRRFTPTECERLQGFDDGWTEGLSDTQRYKTLGNAVTVNVIKEIISKLIK